jgi:hypothetical protein
MTSLWADLRFALRTLVRAPLFSLLVILTLTVGIGATSAVFSVVYPVLLAEPPYPDPDRLVMLSERAEDGSYAGIGWLTFDDTRRETQLFSSMAAMSYWMPTLQAGDDVLRLAGQRVSYTFFETLGVRPALGRNFTPEEDHIETRRVAILSDGLWRRHFGRRPVDRRPHGADQWNGLSRRRCHASRLQESVTAGSRDLGTARIRRELRVRVPDVPPSARDRSVARRDHARAGA